MAELATVARPYAEALFRVAQTEQAKADQSPMTLSAWSALIAELAYLASQPDVLALANNPKVSDAVVIETLGTLLQSPHNHEADKFIATLVENGRLALLPEIAAQFTVLKNVHSGAADAVITSAFEISGAQIGELMSVLEKKFGKKLNPLITVDPALIGGVRVVVGDEVLDTSVRAKLQEMQQALTS